MAFCEPRPRRSVAAAGKELLSTEESRQTFCRQPSGSIFARLREKDRLSGWVKRATPLELLSALGVRGDRALDGAGQRESAVDAQMARVPV
jgi:hypothetical protein